ncbi:MAG: xanthine dehydrogenase family protein molybdopterin-binding subunit [Acidimicrobiales bacterium]
MSILGNRVLRIEDAKFLTTGGVYLADLADPLLAGAAYVTYVRSAVAHAEIGKINVDEARAAPDVVAVFTGADLGLAPLAPPPFPGLNHDMPRPLLATDRARFVGEPIAVIVSEHPEAGADAAESIWIDQTELPVVIDLDDANRDEVLVHPAAGTNTAFDLAVGHTDDLFDGCEVVVRQRIHNQRLAGCPMEPRGGAAAWTGDGRLVLWASTQHVQDIQGALAGIYGLDASAIRVIAPDVGGGFGPKIGAHPEELLLPWIARAVGRPVRWHETRTENMLAMGHGRGQIQDVELGGRPDGTIEAYRITVAADSGAYPEIGAFLPALTRMMAPGVYDIPKVEANARALVTNTNTTRAYRGAGRPEAAAAIERAVDLFAAEIGMDPADVRRANLPPADAFPFTTSVGTTYDTGDYARALDLVLDAAGYKDLLAEQARRREDGDRRALGIGLSIYVEITAATPVMDEYARIEAGETGGNGGFTIYSGTSPHGQGHATAYAMIASEELGVPVDQFRLVHGDTDVVAHGGGTMGSRSLQLGGPAVQKVAVDFAEAARRRAAEVLEADPDDVVLDKIEGKFHVTGTPAVSLTWPEVVAAAREAGEPLDVDGKFQGTGTTFPFGAHVSVVEVDTETGRVNLLRHVAVDDAGRVLNPLLLDGQRHGGIAQGIAQALFEEFTYSPEGTPLTATFADYLIPAASELPSFELVAMETPTPLNPLGAKGIGEAGTIGSTPAVQNAVCNALAHLGVRHIDMPLTPERVWRSIQDAASEGKPARRVASG